MSPTYTYYCESCKTTKEEFFSIKQCPDFISCGCGQQARKEISGNEAFHLKGTCWARDKYTAKTNLKNIKVEG